MRDDPIRVEEAGANVFGLQPRVSLEDRLRRVSGGEHSQDVFHS